MDSKNFLISYSFLLLSLFIQITTSKDSFDDDNGLIGIPDIICNPDTIEMQFKTKKRFTGKIYVQGHYNNPDCTVDFGMAEKDGRPAGGIKLNHGACDMDRQRTFSPDGMMFSTVLIVSFHPLFNTKLDRAFHVQCGYKEVSKVVNSELEVGMTTQMIQNDIVRPVCTYTIRKESVDGPILKYAMVGEHVFHRWECNSDGFGMLIHSCYVEDGHGAKQMVIDEEGCEVDGDVFGDPVYDAELNLAYREGYVFKFADRVNVRFQCEIKLCMKEGEGCDGITPPICYNEIEEDLKNHTTVAHSRHRRSLTSSSNKTLNGDLFSQYLYVLDKDEDFKTGRLFLSSLNDAINYTPICMSPSALSTGIVFLFTAAILIGAIAMLLSYYYKQNKEVNDTIDHKRTNAFDVIYQ